MPIKITSKKHLFRRAGVAHPKGLTEYADGKFSPEQIKTLQAEPMLTVEIVEEEAAEKTPASPAPPPAAAGESEASAKDEDKPGSMTMNAKDAISAEQTPAPPASTSVAAGDPEAPSDNKTGTMTMNAKDAISAIKAAGSVMVLMNLLSEDEDRKSVLEAAEARKAQLETGA